MEMVRDKTSWSVYWDKYENTANGQITFMGGHSTLTDSLDNMPNGVIMNLKIGAICITSDGQGYIWDRILGEWIPQ